jgi:hypothetical protein
MLFTWTVRVVAADRTESCRVLALSTGDLPPLEQSMAEYCFSENRAWDQLFPALRGFFKVECGQSQDDIDHSGHVMRVLRDYVEDENGRRITRTDVARRQLPSENRGVIAVPANTREHDVQLILATQTKQPSDTKKKMYLSQQNVDSLAYFVRDANELKNSGFLSSGPRLCSSGSKIWIENNSDELTGAFVTVFRRLYMTKEPGNFLKACDVYSRNFVDEHLSRWIAAERKSFKTFLESKAALHVGAQPVYSFSNKQLFDTFIYTKYAHQPQPRRIKQYGMCLSEVGSEARLFFMFCTAISFGGMHCVNAAKIIGTGLDSYLQGTNGKPSFDVTPYPDASHPRQKRMVDSRKMEILRQHSSKLGERFWNEEGAVAGQLQECMTRAHEMLSSSLIKLGITFG